MQKLSILLIVLIVIHITACDGKTENYYKNHPKEAKKRSLECRHKAIISQDCVNAYKVGFPKDEWEDKNISNP
ncbi:EexN family lipoprotein [Campylobacter jejuni]|nr:EexN family lipoprotein [Campylobacter jejuni]MBC5860262.1 EexN family lipoprotein [Campylobacter jejuni]